MTKIDRRAFLRVTALAGDGFMLGLYPKASKAGEALAQGGRAPEALVDFAFARGAA